MAKKNAAKKPASKAKEELTVTRSLRFEKNRFNEAMELAEKEQRSFNNWLEWVIQKEIDRVKQ